MTTSTSCRPHKIREAIIAAVFWLALWQLIAMAVGRPLLLPSPAEVFARLCELAVTAKFWLTTGTTLLRVAEGFLAGVVFGTALAALSYALPAVKLLAAPAVKALRAAPVASFIILLVVWFENGRVPVIVAALMVLPIIWESVLAGISSADGLLLEMADAYGFGLWKKITKIYVPSALPSFLAGYKTALGLAWKSGVTAEVIASPAVAVGKELSNGRVYLETPDVFAWTVTVAALSLLLEKLAVRCIAGSEAKRSG